jgi:hypothetical protein
MKTNLKKILEELYALDPDLQEKETELLKILQDMTKNRPDADFDDEFRSQLKQEVLVAIEHEKDRQRSPSRWKSVLQGFFLGGASIAFAAFAVFQFVAPPLATTPNDTGKEAGGQQVAVNQSEVDFGFKKDNKSKGAFGTLAFLGQASAANMGNNAKGGAGAVPATSPMMGGAEGMSATSSKMRADDARIGIMPVPPYEQKVYKYVYSGSGLTIPETEMGVLQKKKNTMTPVETVSLLNNFKISSLDLGKFANLVLNNLSISEDKEFGLSVNMDFVEGNVSISKNWLKWPQSKCQDEACYRGNQVKIEDLPSDEKAIEIASKFIQDYGINVSSYGQPFVNDDWRNDYERLADKTYAYIPENVSVVYPLVIDGKTVYEEYGQPKGITVGVDVKNGRVSDVNGIEKLDFSESAYAIENDFAKILQMAEKGGRNAFTYPMPAEVKTTTVEVKLGEPQLSYTHIYEYKDGQNSQYIVPAIIFPVDQKPKEGEYFPNKIVIPLVKDFFENRNPPIMYKGGIAE